MTRPLTTQAINPDFFEPRDSTCLAWLGMAGVVLNAHGTILLIDPMLTVSEPNGQPLCEGIFEMALPLPITVPDLPRVDFVLYTHADDDHLGRLSAAALAERFPCQFIAPRRVEMILKELQIDPGRILPVRENDTLQAGGVEITVTPALHDYPQADPFEREDCCGYLLKTPEGTIWHPGDTSLIEELLAVKGVDVFFFDIFAVESHLGSQGSAVLAASCWAKALLPYHYGTLKFPPEFPEFTPEDALPFLQGSQARFLVLNPGEPLELPVA